MLFNSFSYLVFLPIVVLMHWLLPAKHRLTFLLIASYVFYMNWIPVYGLLIFLMTVANYFLGLSIDRAFVSGAIYKKSLLIVGLILNLGCLCLFKYANLLWDSCLFCFHWAASHLAIPLPLGISFFVFEFVHYLVDIYHGNKSIAKFRDFALFGAFFPTQIAGPIKRYEDFLPQLESSKKFKEIDWHAGIFLILQGLFKKMVLGDNLGAIVSYGFTHIEKLGTVDAWLAALGFTIQLYFDFSGYTDIGRGSALFLGFKVPENFNYPFFAQNLSEFWRRWHMSLSSWLRDYLFIPLGGSRVSPWVVRRNLFLTMALGGLWHGAAWRYLLWGALHGIGLIVSKEWQALLARTSFLAFLQAELLPRLIGMAITFLFVVTGFVFFRAENLHDAFAILVKMVTWHLSPGYSSQGVLEQFCQSTLPYTLLAYAVFIIIRSTLFQDWLKKSLIVEQFCYWWRSMTAVRLVSYAVTMIIILGFAPSRIAPFIYFQF